MATRKSIFASVDFELNFYLVVGGNSKARVRKFDPLRSGVVAGKVLIFDEFWGALVIFDDEIYGFKSAGGGGIRGVDEFEDTSGGLTRLHFHLLAGRGDGKRLRDSG